ncbi:MAG TPA: DUF5684 domain-containing protein [Crocinitomicaceae bacterium]|nr:DUF5684 domain-containing protein [Crocinitomicaceae bacterium]
MNNSEMAVAAGAGIGILVVYLAIIVFMIAAQWKIFAKAGKPGWACLVPIYNIIVLLEIVGKPTWWIILMLIPLVNFIVLIIVMHQTSLSFGKDTGFTIGMILLPFVFFPILGFGSAQYVGPGGNGNATPAV